MFVTLLGNVFQIFIVVYDFFSALRTMPSVYPCKRGALQFLNSQ